MIILDQLHMPQMLAGKHDRTTAHHNVASYRNLALFSLPVGTYSTHFSNKAVKSKSRDPPAIYGISVASDPSGCRAFHISCTCSYGIYQVVGVWIPYM